MMLNRQMALPREAPASCSDSMTGSSIPSVAAAPACEAPNTRLEMVVLPVMNVPMIPTNGENTTYAWPSPLSSSEMYCTIDGCVTPE